jgi:ribosomal protein S10
MTRALLSNTPIEALDQFRKDMASEGKYFRIRYRGPRNTPKDMGRGFMSRQSTCLKANAKTFSVYLY